MKYGMLGLVLLLSGCAPTLIVLQNPATGQMAQCQGANMSQILAQQDAEGCAKAYERTGWKRVSG